MVDIETKIEVKNDEGALLHNLALCQKCSEDHSLFLLEKKYPKQKGIFPWSR